MLEYLFKKFSLAVSFGYITVDELESIMVKYSYYIHDIYFSPTESLKYQTRYNVYDFENSTNIERRNDLSRIISTARKNDIKISMTLNSSMLDIDDSLTIFDDYNSSYKLDYVTTKTQIARDIKRKFPNTKIICSYNEGIMSYEKLKSIIDSKLFHAIVIGNKYLRDPYAFRMIRKAGIKSILMLNTGCSTGCATFCNNKDKNYCENLFESTISKKDINVVYASQSVFPDELKEYNRHNMLIDVFKLASRPITADELNLLLASYTSGESYSYIQDSINNYHLYARLAYYVRYYSKLNYNRIMSVKHTLWQNIEPIA